MNQKKLISLIIDLKNHPEKVLQWFRIFRFLVAIIFIWFGYFAGWDHLNLILNGIKTKGVIVEYKYEEWKNGSKQVGGYFPIVEFQMKNQNIRFQDWLGSNSRGGGQVDVLYNQDRPETAMIDRAVMNWIPWAPMLGIGLFLLIAGLFEVFKISL